jgi:hypothetical protein
MIMMDSSELTPTFAEDDTQYRRPLAPVITLDGDTAILLTQCDLEKNILPTHAYRVSLACRLLCLVFPERATSVCDTCSGWSKIREPLVSCLRVFHEVKC